MFAGDNAEKETTERRKAAFTTAFLLASVLLYLAAGVFFGIFIPCPFRTVTGLRCPGCGLSHAAVCLTRFDLAGAFKENALFIPIYAYLIYSFLREFVFNIKKNTTNNMIARRIDIVFLIVIILWWIVRNFMNI